MKWNQRVWNLEYFLLIRIIFILSAISSRRYDRPSEREIHNRERTNQNLNASHTDTQLDSSIDPGEFSDLYESLTQYCQTPGLFSGIS